MPSSSAPSGVLGELPARPTKRPRIEASAARWAPGSAALLAPNGTSIPFPFALHHDHLPPNSHVPQLRRADAPEPQGTTAQQPVSEDVAVQEERRAPVDCPSTSGDRRSKFAQLRANILSATWPSSFNALYTADKELIAKFVEGAERGGSSLVTTKVHASMLIRFSDWLRQQSRGGLQGRLFEDELKNDATNFQKGMKSDYLTMALKHLHAFESSPDGTVKIRGFRRHEASDGDKKLINAALSDKPKYATALRAFSAWLHAENKKGLCETDRLHSQALMDDANVFAKTRVPGSQKSVVALRQLRNFYLTGKTDFPKRINRREIREVDRQLYEQYKDILSTTLSTSGPEKKYNNGQTYSGMISGLMASFSGWLKANQKAAMATRLYDTTLDDDLNIFIDKDFQGHARTIRGMLAQVRDIFPSDVQSLEQGNKRQAHDVDRQLSEQFKDALLAPGRETTSINQEKYANMLSAHVRHFSAWLQENEKEPLASRLHETTLDDDLNLYIHGKSLGYKSVLKHMLMQVRQMYPYNVQLPDLGSRAETAEPSDSSMFPLNPEGGWPQAAEGVWIPDTPEQEVTVPALPAQPEASSSAFEFEWGEALRQDDFLSQADQTKWDLDTFTDHFTFSE
ncbi:hypothetical protein [Xanthomonas fragariae]|nr:hypothetical protein [Xanthomonas fragariae]UKR51706.1 hypothetical protein K4A87_13045 [Xanthomonas fragariae]